MNKKIAFHRPFARDAAVRPVPVARLLWRAEGEYVVPGRLSGVRAARFCVAAVRAGMAHARAAGARAGGRHEGRQGGRRVDTAAAGAAGAGTGVGGGVRMVGGAGVSGYMYCS